jgi:hypothetical protein
VVTGGAVVVTGDGAVVVTGVGGGVVVTGAGGAVVVTGVGGALQNPSIRTSSVGQACGGISRRSSMDWTATVVSWIVDVPAISPIACDAKAAPE